MVVATGGRTTTISGKEFSNLVDKYEDDIDNLFVCYPTKSLTPYLSNTDKFNDPYCGK